MTRPPGGRTRDRRLVGPLAVVLLAGVLAVVAARSSDGGVGRPAAVRTVGEVSRSARCADALVVGINGNGERARPGHGFGRTVDAVVRRVVAKAERHGRRIGVDAVPIRTSGPSAMLRSHHRATTPALRALSRPRVRAWRAPVVRAVRRTWGLVTDGATTCPDRPVLLVGYAQGASVVHRVLDRVDERSGLAGLVGGVMIADPDRARHSHARPILGDPPARGRREGVFQAFLRSADDVPRSRGSFAVWSICSAHDLVCDPSHAGVRASIAVDRRYASSHLLRQAARQAWRQTALWPVPDPRRRVLTGTVGEPVRVQLSVGSGGRNRAEWHSVSGLPKGVTISSTGLVSGTPTTAGTFTARYRVAGTAPLTTGHTGVLVLEVAPASVNVSAGGQTTCMTRSDGTASCWGSNAFGQLGDGSAVGRNTPTKVRGVGWADLSASGSTTCGVKVDGTLWCWGLDNFGQLGIGRGGPVHRPHQVGRRHTWTDVSTAWSHTCATRTDGSLWCWGQNLWGQLGIGSISRFKGRPHRVGTSSGWTSVTTGGWHTCALNTAGEAWCWGHNSFGEVGDGSITTRTRPVRVAASGPWLQLSAAWGQTCGITQTGRMLCWGFNRQGQLGDGTLTNHAEPEPVAGGNVWTQVTTGDGFTCGTADDGRLWCWGDNRYGQIGGKPTVWPRPTPTLVTALDSPVHLVSSGWMHTCVIPVGGTVTCWGNDGAGQLGDGGTATAKPLEPARQVELPRSDLPTVRFLRRATPAQIAATGVASRPAAHARTPATRRAADVSPFTIMTMNELGSQHTAPSGDEPQMPPGRIRAEWAGTYYRLKNASLIGTQETQPDQIVALDDATRHRYAFYPGNSTGYAGAPQSVMWRRADWRLVWHSSISIPFQRGWRPQPIVELQQRATGANVYWVNVHFSPRGQQADRNKAMRILLAAMHRLRKDHLPILLTGDFNEKAAAFCTITGKTPMVAATGGSNKGGRCRMPSPAKLDWIFGSGGTFGNALMDHSAQVRRMTDHSVLSALFSTG